ncbi:carboxypeptidase regulatory-like domain-containing protein, partial [Algiphilus sp.]|uniref:carboxypeptidase regulatory-like domain-containing protein n=1 Tax=Algiphilus sp. TaxID=1872431 RepID=UPI003C67EA56
MQQGNSRAPRVIAALCLWAGSMAVANAQDGASLVGRVLTSEGSTGFEGAQVAIPELGRTTTTARDGRYRFNDLPAGAHTVVVRYLGAPEDAERVELDAGERMTVDFRLTGEGTQLEDVLVVGQAAGQAAAINQQRASDNLKSVVSA